MSVQKWPAAVGAWLRTEAMGLRHPALWVALVLLLGGFVLAPQLPLNYTIGVGRNEGYRSDLPYLRDFNGAELSEDGATFRWTTRASHVLLPGVGRRNLIVTLDFMPSAPAVMAMGPQSFTLSVHDHLLVEVPVRMEARRVSVLVPPALLDDGALDLSLRSGIFAPPGDPRLLGVPLGAVALHAPANLGTAPHWSAVIAWLFGALFSWLALRHALGALERPAVLALALLVALAILAALINPPRWAFGSQAVVLATSLAYILAIVVRLGLPALMRRIGVPLHAHTLAWLCLIIVVSFGLRYGGRLYPESMPGDIGFHTNRFLETSFGLIYLRSLNRGVPFPYPPGPYTLVAPLTLLGLTIPTLLQFAAALIDACSVVLVYSLAVRALGQRVALLAGAIYVFTAATFMTTWWSFSTHIFTQFLHLLLMAGLLWAFAAWQSEDQARRRWWTLGVAVLFSLVFLGHFGFLINTTLFGLILASAVWFAGWRDVAWAQRVRWPLTIAGLLAGGFVAIFFYSAYLPMFLEQFNAARTGGLTAVTNRDPIDRLEVLHVTWRAGFVTHYGLFPLLLLPLGLSLLVRQVRNETGLGPQRTLLWLMASGLVVASFFAIFPFVSGVSNNPRWLMSIAWVVAITAALAVDHLWQRGHWARLGVLVMASFTLANTAWLWLGPMLWRIRPPEPF
ncbi:hypothetical protein [Candidatus Viridilinea mediisalina]|uniref:Glycosyltransferase RgtA/B/C/D-like domain-containing protein n=1 Tax=Candidatus Viridilinea mediisalina TaxID=2024553 RepID=A0A2A6RDJ1_9CHLR|nr:hypothetical protein [Candidatus Viridilinea mediisalina]PDV99207.1 hypothetical protein CJ255_21670 [Candidatus Viridilinea mediisalina]